VKPTELIHHLVPVKILTIMMILLVIVNHVHTNVLLVTLKMIVNSVLKTELIHHYVTVHLDIMMLVLLNVYHVTGDV
jgi:hypothetical protein